MAVKVLSPDIVHKSDIGGVKLDLTTEEAVRKAAAEIFERAARLKPQAPRDRRHGAADGAAGQGPRADRRPRGRSVLRPRRAVRARRHGGRGHQRQGAGPAAARSQARRRSHRPHPRVAAPQGLSRRSGGRRGGDCPHAGEAGADGSGHARDPRARHQSAARRPDRRDRGRCPRGGRARDRGRAAAIRASRCGPIRRNGSARSSCATGKTGLRAARPAGGRGGIPALLREDHARRICAFASSRRCATSATPSSPA